MSTTDLIHPTAVYTGSVLLSYNCLQLSDDLSDDHKKLFLLHVLFTHAEYASAG